jgi:hypothetical protein
VPGFDLSQTERLPGTEPVPLTPSASPIEGNSHADLLAPLDERARKLGYAFRSATSTAPAAGGTRSTSAFLSAV